LDGAGPLRLAAMTLQGRVLGGRYALGAMLGAGGMAQVYRARDRVLQRTVAVKVLSSPYDQDPDLVVRFGREARAAAALSHPNIVAVFDSRSDGGVHYLVMEYVDGGTLAALLRREGALAPGRAVGIARAVCQALAAAHALWLVHRDITPGNVLVSSAGMVKVADFGIAKLAAEATLTGDGMLLGTAAYLSPEQAQGRPVDARSDLYALGCVLYELVTGAPPFAGDNPVAVASRQVTEQPEPPSRRNPRVGAALEAVVLTALAKQPTDRHQTASAMAQDLARVTDDRAAGSAPLLPGPAGPPTDRLPSVVPSGSPTVVLPQLGTARRPGRAAWALVVGLGVVVLLAVALWPRGANAPAVRQPTGPAATAAPTTARPAPPPQPQAGLPAALATLTAALTAGRQQGIVDKAAEDLRHQAQEVLGAVQEGKAEDARKKLEDLQRKTDELIQKGKIRGAAAGRVRQAVAQFSRALQPSG
jgi:eukaryotic-like serine/threonine-protein kinase